MAMPGWVITRGTTFDNAAHDGVMRTFRIVWVRDLRIRRCRTYS
jgi:hypothetical protein